MTVRSRPAAYRDRASSTPVHCRAIDAVVRDDNEQRTARPNSPGALVYGVLAPTMDGPFADNIGRREDDPSSKRVPKWSRSPRISDHCTPPVLVDHPGAHRRRVQVVNRWDQPRHAARFSVTTGKCRRLPWKVISHVNRTPGLPLTSVTGFAHGELRGQSVRGSNRG